MRHIDSYGVRGKGQGDVVYLSSSAFENLSSRDEVFAAAERMTISVKAAARIAGIAVVNPVSAERVEEQTPDGPVSTVYAKAGLAQACVLAQPPTVLINGVPPPPPAPIRAELAQSDARVAKALELFARDPNWYDLYKILDVIEEDVGGEKALEAKGWATAAELKRFTATAKNLNATGLDARHAREAWQAPKHPMTLNEAAVLMGEVLQSWLLTKP